MSEPPVFAAFYPSVCLQTCQRLTVNCAWGWVLYAVILGGISALNAEFLPFGGTPQWLQAAGAVPSQETLVSFLTTVVYFFLLFWIGRCGAKNYKKACLTCFCTLNLLLFVFMGLGMLAGALLGFGLLPSIERYLHQCSPAGRCCHLTSGEDLCDGGTLPKNWQQDGDLGTAKFLDCVLSAHPAYDKKYDDTQVLDTICLPEIGASVACADTAGPRPFGMTSDHDFEAQSVSSAIATVADVDESPIVVAIGGRKPGPCTLCDELRSDRLHANWDKFCETIKKQAMAPPAATTNGTAMLMPDAVGNSTMAEATATGGNHDKDLAVMPSDKNTAQTILLAEGHFADVRVRPRPSVMFSRGSFSSPILAPFAPPKFHVLQTAVSSTGAAVSGAKIAAADHLTRLGEKISSRRYYVASQSSGRSFGGARALMPAREDEDHQHEHRSSENVGGDDQEESYPDAAVKDLESALVGTDDSENSDIPVEGFLVALQHFFADGATNTKDFLRKLMKGYLKSSRVLANSGAQVAQQGSPESVSGVASALASEDSKAADEFARKEVESVRRFRHSVAEDFVGPQHRMENWNGAKPSRKSARASSTATSHRDSSSRSEREKDTSTEVDRAASSNLSRPSPSTLTVPRDLRQQDEKFASSMLLQNNIAAVNSDATGALIPVHTTSLVTEPPTSGAATTVMLLENDKAETAVSTSPDADQWWDALLDTKFAKCRLLPKEVEYQQEFLVIYLPGLEVLSSWIAIEGAVGTLIAFFCFLFSLCTCCLIPSLRVLSEGEYMSLRGEP